MDKIAFFLPTRKGSERVKIRIPVRLQVLRADLLRIK